MKIICIIGTRPEAIKMAPLILALKQEIFFDVFVLATAQHRNMLDQVLDAFSIKPDFDLNVMQPGQSLSELSSRLLTHFDHIIKLEKPDIIIAQGDTTSVMIASLSSFYHHIPFAHIEAGLRTHDFHTPYPEELNRVFVSKIARWHFAPTENARKNLLNENISNDSIFVTGNTVIDALNASVKLDVDLPFDLDSSKRLILVTTHRRENFGKPLDDICNALLSLANNNTDIQILLPVHPNPQVRHTVNKKLSHHERILLSEPLDYLPFVKAMKKSYFVLTDSGGVQEEAPALGKPVLVLREETERPEAIDAGVVKLIGTQCDDIVREAQLLLDDHVLYQTMAKHISPYGDGHASERIVGTLKEYFAKKNS
jgi:UDP-N-acetylglucosamine 2-epimerase (non-hydrolysing)